MTGKKTDFSGDPISRRRFLGTAGVSAAVFTVVPRHVLGGPGRQAPSDTLNVAGIGIGGMGFNDIRTVAGLGENIVALCDVDQRHAAKAFNEFPKARKWQDYRKMLEEQKDIDAVTIATPDHLHAPITMAAIKAGKHVYCQKPLTHTVYEARQIARAAKEAGVVTQMGNQGQAGEGPRLLTEFIWDGAIGNVREVHGWSNRYPRISPRGQARPQDTPPIPDGLDWNLWLGPAPERPYHLAYLPFVWRGWWDFGTGVLGDIGCHNFSAIFKALKLKYPKTVQASGTFLQDPPEIRNESAPIASVVHYEFEADDNHPAVTLTWYDGGMLPNRPPQLEQGRRLGGGDGMLYIGDKGAILDNRLIPEARMKEYGKPPQKLPRSPGHYKEWIIAAKGGPKAGSDFSFAGPLTEVVLLGNIAIRTGEKLEWDPIQMKITNVPDANKFLHYEYRNGWSL
ncbi:MAG: Gfo/Idh/MocA family oxidoreductase [Sedimentisphaerales bacterium]|nr:Gfo/Idh/MocA family oxidoreductase [Sedimentisphaerales bacterium]